MRNAEASLAELLCLLGTVLGAPRLSAWYTMKGTSRCNGIQEMFSLYLAAAGASCQSTTWKLALVVLDNNDMLGWYSTYNGN